jgi:hypothetical protein
VAAAWRCHGRTPFEHESQAATGSWEDGWSWSDWTPPAGAASRCFEQETTSAREPDGDGEVRVEILVETGQRTSL